MLQSIIEATLLPFDLPSVRRNKLTAAIGFSQSEPLDPGLLDEGAMSSASVFAGIDGVHHGEVYHPHQPRSGRNIPRQVMSGSGKSVVTTAPTRAASLRKTPSSAEARLPDRTLWPVSWRNG
jgi:hypothetical protein